jgi:hypothetical protein
MRRERMALTVVMAVLGAIGVTPRAGWPQAPVPVNAPVNAPANVGRGTGGDTAAPRRVSRGGAYWQALSGKEKDAYVRGYLAGARSEQVREIAVAAHRMADSAVVPGAVETAIVDSLRVSHAVRFAFAATVYVAQLDDFYWWQDHAAVPVDDALIRINAQMEAQQSRP